MPEKNDDVTKSSIPLIIIGDKYYFPIKGVDKWLTETEVEGFY